MGELAKMDMPSGVIVPGAGEGAASLYTNSSGAGGELPAHLEQAAALAGDALSPLALALQRRVGEIASGEEVAATHDSRLNPLSMALRRKAGEIANNTVIS